MTAMGEARIEQMLRRLPPDVRETLSEDQTEAIRRAMSERWPEPRHPLDLRLSLPWPGGGIFIALVGGRERRSPARRRMERASRPLGTIGNVLFFIMLAILLALLMGGGMAIA
ncbi:MAG TPA: hypothetical protein VHA10_16645 [Hypericibacter adhaerens]|jgi:hypothetical protein|uniref:Uncharacterized protein n=1 Tax=Hypericibacter adhaerens TaxID=2602016 RepID=A0A5J6N891_9PROT|nr:hypothetical protein [Hypericibacter adhaerens]QEX25193.1 hypothetical protein FRZ61_51400 [Hypericibacter adhaerens]HWA44849.1 hypothetical protein [Hypericibacter adhaerens]